MQRLLKKLSTMPYLLLGAALVVLGTMATSYIVNNFWPFEIQRLDLVRATVRGEAGAALLLDAANFEIILAFLATVALIVVGFVLPLVFFLDKRFGTEQPRFLLVVRQASWVGIWFSFCIWLQMNRALGVAIALLVAGVLVIFEILLQVRSRAAAQAQVFGENV